MVLQGLTNYFSKKLPTLKKSDEEFSGRPYLQDLTDARFPETQLWLHSVTITILQYTYIYIHTYTTRSDTMPECSMDGSVYINGESKVGNHTIYVQLYDTYVC